MAELPSTHYLTPKQAAQFLGVAEQTLVHHFINNANK